MNSPVRRHALGLVSLLFIGAGLWVYLAHGGDKDDKAMLSSILLRAGLVMGALWLALPQLFELMTRQPPWLLGCIAIGLGVLIFRPKLFVFVAPVLGGIVLLQVVGWFLKPLPQPRTRQSRKSQPRDPQPRDPDPRKIQSGTAQPRATDKRKTESPR